MPRHAGYTLIEYVLVLLVLCVLAGLSAPAFSNLRQESRMTAAVNAFVHGMHVARVAALTRGVDVALCRSADGRRCTYAGPWQTGFIVFVNRDQDNPPQVDPGEGLLAADPGSAEVLIEANRQAFVFRPFGKRSVNGTIRFCDARGPARARAVIVSYTGRPRAAAAATSGQAITCPR